MSPTPNLYFIRCLAWAIETTVANRTTTQGPEASPHFSVMRLIQQREIIVRSTTWQAISTLSYTVRRANGDAGNTAVC